jgi:PAS domain-containing protein
VFSDYLLNSFFDGSAELLRWQLINGYCWVVLSAGLIFIARARLFQCLGGGAKLRERQADRDRLRQAAAVFDCTREGVLVTDSNGLIVHVNRAFMTIRTGEANTWQCFPISVRSKTPSMS